MTKVDVYAAKSALEAHIMIGLLDNVSVVLTTNILALIASVLTVRQIALHVRTQHQE